MPLNAEERMQHEKFKREQYARPTEERLEIAKLEEELNLTRNRLDQANHYIDKMTKQRDRVNGAISLYKQGKRLEGVTLDDIRMIMRHPL